MRTIDKTYHQWLVLPLLFVLISQIYGCNTTAPALTSTEPKETKEPLKYGWNEMEINILRSLWIGSLPPLQQDPSNAYSDNPEAASLGRQIFFDKRFSANGKISCATCHKPELAFTDGLARARAIGKTKRSTPSIVGTAYSPWLFWDGRSDSQWSQALGPLENAKEHGGSRMQYAHIIDQDNHYRKKYESIFVPMPDLSSN